MFLNPNMSDPKNAQKKDARPYSKEIIKSATLTFNKSRESLKLCSIFDGAEPYSCAIFDGAEPGSCSIFDGTEPYSCSTFDGAEPGSCSIFDGEEN